jgi:hypothetical protein
MTVRARQLAWMLAACLAGPAAHALYDMDACQTATVETRRVTGVRVDRVLGTPTTVEFEAGFAVDADGSPRAYHPDDTGTDRLAHAGEPGNWWALATDDGTPAGTPIVQGPTDPAPGHYVSTTSLVDAAHARSDPRRYVDSEAVPYLALPDRFIAELGCAPGDLAWVERTGFDGTQHRSAAIFADVAGPRAPLGEGSIALAGRLGIASSPRTGGTYRQAVRYVLFCGTAAAPPWPRSVESIDAEAARLDQARRARDAAQCPR